MHIKFNFGALATARMFIICSSDDGVSIIHKMNYKMWAIQVMNTCGMLGNEGHIDEPQHIIETIKKV